MYCCQILSFSTNKRYVGHIGIFVIDYQYYRLLLYDG